jgi:hypothetical protein
MRKVILRKSFLLIATLFLTTISINAQSSRRVSEDAAWNPFWRAFAAAVNARSTAGLRRLAVPARDFFSGGGAETREQWFRMVNRDKLWGLLQRSVRSGTRRRVEGKTIERVTNDNGLVFVFVRGRWRFNGPMGD